MTEILTADLNTKPIHDILQWIDMNRLSCVVAVTLDNDSSMTLCMEEGSIIYVSSSKEGYRLGEFLVNSGMLPEQEIARALEESRNAEVSFTRYLIDQSMISVADLSDALQQLVEKILVEVFVSRNGSVSVTSPLPAIITKSPVLLDTGLVISDALRIFDEMDRGR